jgi:D-alanyl-D-alanine carboxypeptidase/D-alanyl-D-alanine-endopeptidase (penicillin-binding protein 4)
VLRSFLSAAGVEVAGNVTPGTTPENAVVLARHRSKPLSLIVRDLNKYSNNFVAEQLVKSIGAHAVGPPGTTAAGTAVLTDYLREAGGDSASCRVVDGSGFSRENRLSPRSIVAVIRRVLSDFATSYEYVSSLSVSGTDGTLGDRMGYPGLQGTVRAKTGLLDGVTAISGIMQTSSGEEVLFSIIVNGFACEAWRAHDLEHAILTIAARS